MRPAPRASADPAAPGGVTVLLDEGPRAPPRAAAGARGGQRRSRGAGDAAGDAGAAGRAAGLILAIILSSGVSHPTLYDRDGDALPAAPARDDSAAVFAAVFLIVWCGSAVVTVNAVLLGGTVSFFQSICILGYCVFPLTVAALVAMAVGWTACTSTTCFLVRFAAVSPPPSVPPPHPAPRRRRAAHAGSARGGVRLFRSRPGWRGRRGHPMASCRRWCPTSARRSPFTPCTSSTWRSRGSSSSAPRHERRDAGAAGGRAGA